MKDPMKPFHLLILFAVISPLHAENSAPASFVVPPGLQKITEALAQTGLAFEVENGEVKKHMNFSGSFDRVTLEDFKKQVSDYIQTKRLSDEDNTKKILQEEVNIVENWLQLQSVDTEAGAF